MGKFIKYFMVSVLGWIMVVGVIYLCAAFIAYEFNPKYWEESMRAFISISSCLFFIITFIIAGLQSMD